MKLANLFRSKHKSLTKIEKLDRSQMELVIGGRDLSTIETPPPPPTQNKEIQGEKKGDVIPS